MRKITSKIDEADRKKRNQFIVGGVLVFIMISSTLGYAFQGRATGNAVNENGKIVFNGFEFTRQNDFWILDFQGVNLIFKYNPEEINNSKENLYINSYSGKPLYIYSENTEAEYEIQKNLVYFVERIQRACFDGEECSYENVPIKDCTENFIIIKEDTEGKILQEKNCIFIQGQGEDLIKKTDEFLFKIFKII